MDRRYRNAAGRNWVHDPERSAPRRPLPDYPLREAGGGDHDRPYTYTRPTSRWSFPFNQREYARLLLLKGRVLEDRLRQLQPAGDSGPFQAGAPSRPR